MRSFGILTTNRGYHVGVGEPYKTILRQHAVAFNVNLHENGFVDGFVKIPPKPKPKGKSKLQKWQCPCGQNARVGKKEFHATCDICGEQFQKAA